MVLGDANQPPQVSEAMEILARLDGNLVLNLLGVDLADRPAFLGHLLPELCRLRARTGRPHWIVIDEAHHMLPAAQTAAGATLPQDMRATILVTVHPDQVAPDALRLVQAVMAVGAQPAETMRSFCTAVGDTPPLVPEDAALEPTEALFGSAVPQGRHAGCGSPARDRRDAGIPANTPKASLGRTAASSSAGLKVP